MARTTQREKVELRVKEVPKTLHRRIVIHQKILSMKAKKEVTIDEACIDLLSNAVDHAGIPGAN